MAFHGCPESTETDTQEPGPDPRVLAKRKKKKKGFDLLPLSLFQVSLWKQREVYMVSWLCAKYKSIFISAKPLL